MIEATTEPQVRQAMKKAHVERAKAVAEAVIWLRGVFRIKRRKRGVVAAPCLTPTAVCVGRDPVTKARQSQPVPVSAC